jgi:phage shock protein A
MFNKKVNELIEELSDSIYLLSQNIKELKEEVDYLYDKLGLDD